MQIFHFLFFCILKKFKRKIFLKFNFIPNEFASLSCSENSNREISLIFLYFFYFAQFLNIIEWPNFTKKCETLTINTHNYFNNSFNYLNYHNSKSHYFMNNFQLTPLFFFKPLFLVFSFFFYLLALFCILLKK